MISSIRPLPAMFLITSVLSLVACGGGSSGGVQGNTGSEGGASSSPASSREFFATRVASRLDFCRTCHLPGGVADVEDGRGLMLSSNTAEDYERLYSAWELLGGGAASSPLLIENSDPFEPHSGGKSWPKDGEAYSDMLALFSCWDDPQRCGLVAGGSVAEALPLLGSTRGGHAWADYCESRPDSALLPADPRTLVQPGISEGRAVYFNLFWEECRSAADPAFQPPQTCGHYRQWRGEGETLVMGNGAIGAGSTVGGDYSDGMLNLSSDAYNTSWIAWGMPGRPSNFDALAAERWGMALSDERNPYPLPGEDPNASNGGSGQLPMALTQVREADGSWTGKLGITCHACHSTRIESNSGNRDLGVVYGTSGQSDLGVFIRDLAFGLGAAVPVSMNRTRGTGNVTNYQLLVMLWLIGDEPALQGIDLDSFVFAPSTATEDAPIWWNIGHRPAKFYSGAMPMDATRIALQAYMPLLRESEPYNWEAIQRWTDAHDRQAVMWVESLKAPHYPLAVDTALAEQGAVLFHSKDLWAANLNNPVPRPEGGNGSCAGCHGAYSPRYVNDPSYLADPALEGQAGFRVPNEIIGTDTAYTAAQNQGVTDYFKYSWLFYPPAPGEVGACYGSDDYQTYQGYTAPPLYGVWASAPYFHNGSVPNVWEVLKSADRQPIWRRVSKASSGMNVVMGYDNQVDTAYDSGKLGWRYDSLECGSLEALPYLDCDPADPQAASPLQDLIGSLNEAIGLSWNVDLPMLTPQQIEERKIYNTHMYSQNNGGHRFTDVLSDAERRAIIEYLKTL